MSGEFCPANDIAERVGVVIPESDLPDVCRLRCFFVAKLTAENDSNLPADHTGSNTAHMEVQGDVFREVRITRRDDWPTTKKPLASFRFRCNEAIFAGVNN